MQIYLSGVGYSILSFCTLYLPLLPVYIANLAGPEIFEKHEQKSKRFPVIFSFFLLRHRFFTGLYAFSSVPDDWDSTVQNMDWSGISPVF
jgi:cytochrome c biogenesis protein CcdA